MQESNPPSPARDASQRKPWPSWAFYWLTVLLMCIVLLVSKQTPDPDLWGRLSIAALYFQNGAFPYHDVFSFTAPNAPWYDHEWLTGFVFYQIMQAFGEPGLVTFRYLMLGAVFAFLFSLHKRCYRASALFAFYGLLALSCIYLIGFYATLRSHVFTFFFFMLTLWLLEQVRSGLLSRKVLLGLPPIAIVWANLHGGFIMGVVLVSIYGLGDAFRYQRWQAAIPLLSLAAGMFLLAGIVNPYGLDYLKFLIHAWTLNRQHIFEWHPIPWHEPLKFWPAKLMIFGTLFPVACRWVQLKRSGDTAAWRQFVAPTLVLLWLTVFTLKSIRFQSFLAFAVLAYLPLLVPGLELFKWGEKTHRLLKNTQSPFARMLPVLICLLAVGCLAYMNPHQPIFRVRIADEMTQGDDTRYPLGAVEFLRQSPYRGNLIVRFGFGEMIYWMLYPRFKVSMDGRYEEVYSQEQFLSNFKFFNARQKASQAWALNYPDQIGADFMLVEYHFPHEKTFMTHLDAHGQPKWQLIYTDQYFRIFARTSTLRKFPAYTPMNTFLTLQVKTIGDYVTDADLKRFKN